MREEVKIGEIKRAIKENKALTTGLLKGKEMNWGFRDSPLLSFGESFFSSLPEDFLSKEIAQNNDNMPEDIFQRYIEATLSEGRHKNLTAVEFGGSGSRLFRGFGGFFDKTVGVCLKDVRSAEDKDFDRSKNHYVIEGDIFNVLNGDRKELIEKILKKLHTKKADLIISRMHGPLSVLNLNEAILERIIRNWYDLLNENGLMFIQFNFEPMKLEPLRTNIDKWAQTLQDKFPDLDIQVSRKVLRLHKRVGSPETILPATQLFSKKKKPL